jgi:hypothetical protein
MDKQLLADILTAQEEESRRRLTHSTPLPDYSAILGNGIIKGLASVPDFFLGGPIVTPQELFPEAGLPSLSETPVQDYLSERRFIEDDPSLSTDTASQHIDTGGQLVGNLLASGLPLRSMVRGGAIGGAGIRHSKPSAQVHPAPEIAALKPLDTPDPFSLPTARAPISRTGLPDIELSDRERLVRALEAVEEQAIRLREPKLPADIELDRLGSAMMEAYHKTQDLNLPIDERIRWAKEFAKRKADYIKAGKPTGQTFDLKREANGVYRQGDELEDPLERIGKAMMEAQRKSMDQSLSQAERDRWTAKFIRLRDEYVGDAPPGKPDGF